MASHSGLRARPQQQPMQQHGDVEEAGAAGSPYWRAPLRHLPKQVKALLSGRVTDAAGPYHTHTLSLSATLSHLENVRVMKYGPTSHLTVTLDILVLFFVSYRYV